VSNVHYLTSQKDKPGRSSDWGKYILSKALADHLCSEKLFPVYIDWSNSHLGGRRPWFLCPAQDCGRRVALLYCGGIFACRHCYQLVYPTQREEAHDRSSRRADRIRKRLGWELGILNGKGWSKPKGMHWKTFERLNKEHDAFVQISLTVIAARLKLLGGSIDDLI
jgi:hypothetical protein